MVSPKTYVNIGIASKRGAAIPLEGEPSIICDEVSGILNVDIGATCLESNQGLALVVLIRRRSCRLSSDYGKLHMLDLQPDQ